VNVDALAQRAPGLASISGEHLDETAPYVWPRAGTVALLLCHWPAQEPIPVSVSADATPQDGEAVEAALRAWEGAGLGVRFARVRPGLEHITIVFQEDAVATATGDGVGSTTVDCKLGSAEPAVGPTVPAETYGAVIRIGRRTRKDFRHRDRALTPEEIAGTVLHELGHALGFQGHVSHGDTAMVRSRDDIRERGRALLRGERLTDPTLRALYTLPSGTVVQRLSVSPARTEPVDRLAEAAGRLRLRGPYLRVGDLEARVFWRDATGEELGVVVPDVKRMLRDPETLTLEAEPATLDRLGASGP
jgi:hypothetical protein